MLTIEVNNRKIEAKSGEMLLEGGAGALKLLVALVGCTLILAALLMRGGLGQANRKAKFGQMFSRNAAVNKLAAARIFLFGARDVWFVVGLPVFLSSVLGWTFWQSGGFLAVWVIGYGIVQSFAPAITGMCSPTAPWPYEGQTTASSSPCNRYRKNQIHQTLSQQVSFVSPQPSAHHRHSQKLGIFPPFHGH